MQVNKTKYKKSKQWVENVMETNQLIKSFLLPLDTDITSIIYLSDIVLVTNTIRRHVSRREDLFTTELVCQIQKQKETIE